MLRGVRSRLLLRYRAPFDWPTLLSWLRVRAIPTVELVSPERYARTIELDGRRGTLSVEPAAGDALCATIDFPLASALPAVRARLTQLFDLNAEPARIGAQLARDPALAPLIAARPGLRVPGAWDAFELAVRAVLGQQISVVAAASLAKKLVQMHGEPAASPDPALGLTRVFPSPRKLAEADLTQLGMPRTRAAALSSLARSVAEDPSLLSAPDGLERAVTRLCALPGIGPWTAHYIAMRALREPDAFPLGDVVLAKTAAQLEGRVFTREQLAKHAERWQPYRAYAAQHMWAFASAQAALRQSKLTRAR